MLKKGQTAETVITGYTSDGLGVCRIDGCAVFVPDTIRGERCVVQVTHVGKNSAHGRLEKLIERSPHRIVRACPYAKRCGSCAFQHMDYAEETALKQQRVRDALWRIGGVVLWSLPITPAQSADGYRNKVQYPVQTQFGKPAAGYYMQHTHTVVPVERCRIVPEVCDRVKACVLAWMQRFKLRAYDEESGRGLLRHIYVRVGFATGQVLVCLVINGSTLPQSDALLGILQSEIPGLTSVVLSVNQRRGNVILGEKFITLYGSGDIEDVLCGLRFRLSPRSFYQVNRDQAERLYEKAVALAELHGEETVLDLYCGTGTITLVMARRAKRVVGVEIIPEAIADAKENARRNGIENAEFYCADAAQAARRFADAGQSPDVIVIDPPRKGVAPEVIDAIVQMAPVRLVYVSCDPATLARDVKQLTERGYALQNAEAVDMFPRTAHVETVCLFTRETGQQRGMASADME